MMNKKNIEEDIKKYTSEEIVRLRSKFNGRDFSRAWLYKHFREMMRYIEWLNGSERAD